MLKRILTILMPVLFIFGCASKNADEEKIRIGLSLPTQSDARWVRDLGHLREAAAAMDVELLVKISEKNAFLQQNQCEELLEQNIKILIIAPHDARALDSVVEKAKEKGVKVISYDRLILGADIDFYVSFDNVKVGEMQASYISKKAPFGNYIVLSGASTDNNAKLFHTGAMKVLQPLADAGQINIIADRTIPNWSADEAEKIAEEVVSAYSGDIHAVLAPNDNTAGGVIRVLKKHHIAGLVPVSGQDADVEAVHRIMQGVQAMTIFKDTHHLAGAALGAAITMAMGQPPPMNSTMYNGRKEVPSLLLEPLVVDKSNIVQTLVQTGYLTREQVYSTDTEANKNYTY